MTKSSSYTVTTTVNLKVRHTFSEVDIKSLLDKYGTVELACIDYDKYLKEALICEISEEGTIFDTAEVKTVINNEEDL